MNVSVLCETAVQRAWRGIAPHLESVAARDLTPRVTAALQDELHRTLSYISAPSASLFAQASSFALDGLAASQDPPVGEPNGTSNLFAAFPELARLTRQAVSLWQQRTTELFQRLAADRAILIRDILHKRDPGKLIDIATGLSDPHNGGATVLALRFEAGRVIYKPRSGHGEEAWQKALLLIDRRRLLPSLRRVQVLNRGSYCWMEYVQRAPCQNIACARRFYRRAGALAAAAELLHAVDCHKGNLIAAGEHPVLIDADALLHPAPGRVQVDEGPASATQFFAGRRRQDRSRKPAALSAGDRGAHVPRLDRRYLSAADFEPEIIAGFVAGWSALAGTPPRRAALRRLCEQVRQGSTRRIYRATSWYAAVRNTSIAPPLMRDAEQRRRFLERTCAASSIAAAISAREAEQLRQLDIPYFRRRGVLANTSLPPEPPRGLLTWIRQSLRR